MTPNGPSGASKKTERPPPWRHVLYVHSSEPYVEQLECSHRWRAEQPIPAGKARRCEYCRAHRTGPTDGQKFDVYLFLSPLRNYVCASCTRSKGMDRRLPSTAEAIRHLQKHLADGETCSPWIQRVLLKWLEKEQNRELHLRAIEAKKAKLAQSRPSNTSAGMSPPRSRAQ